MKALLACGSFEVLRHGKELILIREDDQQLRLPAEPFLPSGAFLDAISFLGFAPLLASRYIIVDQEDGFGHLVLRTSPKTAESSATANFLARLQSFSVIGGRPCAVVVRSSPRCLRAAVLEVTGDD